MSAPPEIILDAETRETLATLLAFRLRVWERIPAAAKGFDEVVSDIDTVLRILRERRIVESERNMAGFLERVDAGVSVCVHALREKGESEIGEGLAKAVAAVTAPARDHLGTVRARAHVPAGRNAVVDLLPQEYLILCADCGYTAERLRVLSDSVCFSWAHMVVPSPSFPLERAQALVATLEREGAAALCEQIEQEGRENVIGYCPECRALYCPTHYKTQTTWSGSWFDTLYGTCPKGHRRELA